MTEIPPRAPTLDDLAEWYRIKEQLNALKAKEALLRRFVFNGFFPTPKEGTNSYKLPDGFVLKATYPIDRAIDEAAMTALADPFREAGISVDSLIRRKPELVVKEYRTLTAEQATLFDQCLVIKPGSPQLEIVKPAKAAT